MATKTSNFVSLRVSLFILLLFISSQVAIADAKHLQQLRRKLQIVRRSRSQRGRQYNPPTLRVPPPPPPPLPQMPSAATPPPMPQLSPLQPKMHVSSLQPQMLYPPPSLPYASSPTST
ncbi:transmembrane protein [Arabidopsis thaliana]|uniref:Serine rich endogenous peptide 5 n=1 Tax=Arabidopsis thaliana TaxID=3702 RepID=SCOP5_ARATH|nr:uncharacterized protein AT5G44570 [Arabidopsis thaliana]Q56WV9.1 RecName: Full=Serine rich endogenous peptide 5; Short=AtSCOOP5; AltName: Full=Phytocytokine SCOOP5; AltName: Full=Precursor of serine rich endogenous peptide phytocytokine 5; Flags: Precursor [Arabidopsis thaliana]ANM70265.1 transmembrane protein [Arabidopsis thaliana]BAD94335.1 hypothetical protein [Arabidopsis thaliana]|eukprot:NP_001331891.1 transmembrane protein [Arabidopsis thaliana]